MSETIIDPWTWLDHKPTFSHRTAGSWQAPMWVGEHFRRLQAYRILDSYYRNASREWMDPSMDEEDRANRREYGDAQTVVNQILTSLIGHDQSIIVGGNEQEQASAGAKAQSELLHTWADQENFSLKLLAAERDAVKLGDGVYVLGWDNDANRPRCTVWDPGFYFPVLDPTVVTDDYPKKIHLAYEYEDPSDDGSPRRYVRRITWELLELEDGETVDYPWNDEPTNVACFMTDATWRIEELERDIDDLVWENAIYADYMNPETGEVEDWNMIDIGLDFIPVVHLPNMAAGADHFGQSSLSAVVQILDDLVSTDTDLQAASATTGTPPIALAGSTAPKDDDGNITSYGPGTVLETGDGTATMIDTSRSLDALLKYDGHLLERLSVNGRVPESLLGRVKPNEVPSGIALTLSFAPHSSMIQEMRLVRTTKYQLLFKFIVRMYQLWGDEDISFETIYPITLKFGTFLPADKKETVDLVVQLMSSKAISIETAVRMLMEAGFPIEEAGAEVERIRMEDFEKAGQMLDATGDMEAVRKRLKLTGPAPTPPQPPAPVPGSENEPVDTPAGEPGVDELPTPGQQ